MQKAILEQVCVEQNLEDRKRRKPQQQAGLSHAADSDADSNSNLKDTKPENIEKNFLSVLNFDMNGIY